MDHRLNPSPNPDMYLCTCRVSQRSTACLIGVVCEPARFQGLNGTILQKLTTMLRFLSPDVMQVACVVHTTADPANCAPGRRPSRGSAQIQPADFLPGLHGLEGKNRSGRWAARNAARARRRADPDVARKTVHQLVCPAKQPHPRLREPLLVSLLLLRSPRVYLGLERFKTQSSSLIRTSDTLTHRFRHTDQPPRPGIGLGKFPA